MKKDDTHLGNEQDDGVPSSDDGEPPSSEHPNSHREASSSRLAAAGKPIKPELSALARAFPEMRARFEFLYGNLNVLDSKASFLLGFNAIALAAVAVWLEDVEPNLFHLILDAVFLGFLGSSFLCLWAIAMHWSSADHLLRAFPEPQSPPAPSAAPISPDTPLIAELLKIRDRRSSLYRRARVCSLLAVSLFFGVSAIHAYGTVACLRNPTSSECDNYCDGTWGHKACSQAVSSSAAAAPVDRARAVELAQRWLEALRRRDLDLLLESTATPMAIEGFSAAGPGAGECIRVFGVRDADSPQGVAVTAADPAQLSQTLRCLFLDNRFVSYIPDSDGGEWPANEGRAAGIRVGGLRAISLEELASALQLFRSDLESKEGTHHFVQARMTDNDGVTNHAILTLPKSGPERVDAVYINELFEE